MRCLCYTVAYIHGNRGIWNERRLTHKWKYRRRIPRMAADPRCRSLSLSLSSVPLSWNLVFLSLLHVRLTWLCRWSLKQQVKQCLCEVVVVTTRFVRTQPKPGNLVKPPDTNPILVRTEGPVSQQRVSVFKNQHLRVKWRVCFSKTQATWTRLESYKKSGQIYKNKPNPARSRLDLVRSRRDPVRFGGI